MLGLGREMRDRGRRRRSRACSSGEHAGEADRAEAAAKRLDPASLREIGCDHGQKITSLVASSAWANCARLSLAQIAQRQIQFLGVRVARQHLPVQIAATLAVGHPARAPPASPEPPPAPA